MGLSKHLYGWIPVTIAALVMGLPGLNHALVSWAYRLTADVRLDDTAVLQAIRARYPDRPQAMLAPHVMKGDEVSSSNWWVGTLMNKSAEDWMAYWTGGQGVAVMTAMEDSGVLCSLSRLAKIGRVDFNRVMVLRTASNYSVPGKGDTAADLVAVDGSNNLSAFVPALEAAFRVGSIVVDQLASHWALYESRPPSAIETRK